MPGSGMTLTRRPGLSEERAVTRLETVALTVAVGVVAAIGMSAYLQVRDRESDAGAKSHVRAIVPALEGYYNDHGTYRGVTLERLRSGYDPTLDVRDYRLGRLTASAYCVESTVGGKTWRKNGPSGELERGSCR